MLCRVSTARATICCLRWILDFRECRKMAKSESAAKLCLALSDPLDAMPDPGVPLPSESS